MTKKKAASKEVATREAKTPAQQVAHAIELMRPQFEQALPEGVSLDRFMRTTMTAIQNTPALLEADRRTLFHACARAAQDGLMPDGRHGAIVTFGGAATWMPMVAGRRLQAYRNGTTIDAQVVYQYEVDNGLFRAFMGDNPRIEHQPAPPGVDRGDIVAVYAIATLKDGRKIREVMHRDEIDKAMKASRSSGKGPWKDWYSEMARKTCVNRISKALPDHDLLSESVRAEEEELYGGELADDGTIIDAPASDGPSAIRRAVQQHRGQTVEQDDEPPADDEPEQPPPHGEAEGDDGEAEPV